MSIQAWLAAAKKGDFIFVCTGSNYLPDVITKAYKLTLHVRKLKFRRKDGTFMRPRCSPMSVRGAAQYRIMQRECCEGEAK